jgi:Mitochondrial carrier protein
MYSIIFPNFVAGSVSWGVIVPLDVIKSRLQADNPQRPRYRGMVHCAVSSFRQDGISVFGRGFWMVVGRAFPANAAIFFGYEHCMRSCQTLLV